MDISLHRVEKIELEENCPIGKDENVSHYRQIFITVREPIFDRKVIEATGQDYYEKKIEISCHGVDGNKVICVS
tara:strand:- start:188 stop:409 length:222 start_codon:yes stop_codon:yes gene_type:complete